jgi:hypothetical protein
MSDLPNARRAALRGEAPAGLTREDIKRLCVAHNVGCPVNSLAVESRGACTCGADEIVEKLEAALRGQGEGG